LRITDIVWKVRTVEKLSEKHSVSVADAEETHLSRPVVRKITRGRVRGEDVYAVLAQIETGRHLVVFSFTRSMALRCRSRRAIWTLQRGVL